MLIDRKCLQPNPVCLMGGDAVLQFPGGSVAEVHQSA